MFISFDIWNQVIKHLTDNRLIPQGVALLLQQVSLQNDWFNRGLREDTIRGDVTF